MDIVYKIGDWCVSYSAVYLCIYGSMKAPHQLPLDAPNKLLILKIAYQTYVGDFKAAMARKKRMT